MASLRDIGQNLKEAREAQGVTLEDIAAKTRITVRHLIALEEGNESDLPEVFYVRGFLKKYAEAVGLSPKDVADAYRAAPIPTPSNPSMGASAGPIIYYLLILALIGGCLWLAWYFQPKISVVAEPSPTPSPSAVASPSPTPVVVGPMPAPTASAAAAVASTAPASPDASAAVVLAASTGPDASPGLSGSPAATAAPSAAPSAQPSVSPSVRPSVAPSVAPSPRPTPRPSPRASALPQGQVSVTRGIL